MPEQTLEFPVAGSKAVSTTWQLYRTYSGWEAIQILSPVTEESNHAEFSFKCLAVPIVTAELTADPASYTGPCPAKIGFNGRITVSEACLLKYKFVRSDGTRGPEQSLKFDAAGTKSVHEIWESAVPDAGWGAIEILSPVSVPSNKAMFTNQCVNGPTITATLTADPDSTTGPDPVPIVFNGTITVSEPCTVRYRFIRSDGASGPGENLTFPKAGSKPVRSTWLLRGSFTGWEAIQIISPFSMQSNRANFSINRD